MAFADPADVGVRLLRQLSDDESALATQVIETVTGLIIDEVDRDADWADALDPVPPLLKGLCIEKAVGVLVNPQGAASVSESLGQYQYSQTFPRSADLGIYLSDEEARRVRAAVYGSNSGSSSPRSMIDRGIDLREGRDVDEVEA